MIRHIFSVSFVLIPLWGYSKTTWTNFYGIFDPSLFHSWTLLLKKAYVVMWSFSYPLSTVHVVYGCPLHLMTMLPGCPFFKALKLPRLTNFLLMSRSITHEPLQLMRLFWFFLIKYYQFLWKMVVFHTHLFNKYRAPRKGRRKKWGLI